MTERGTAPLTQWRGGLCPSVLVSLVVGAATLAARRQDDDRPRMLLLLVMHSAGPLGPYGALGR